MRTRLLTLFAAVLLATGISLSGGTPALAAAGGTCTENALCLYQWINYGAQVAGDRWQSTLSNIIAHPGGCLNLPPAAWHNGTAVADNSGSLQLHVNDSTWFYPHQIEIFNWTNCNEGGGYAYWSPTVGNTSFTIPDMASFNYYNNSISTYHTVTSVKVQ